MSRPAITPITSVRMMTSQAGHVNSNQRKFICVSAPFCRMKTIAMTAMTATMIRRPRPLFEGL